MIRHYCTYFDDRYFPRGMAMVESLRRHSPEARVTVLCLSEVCKDMLREFAEKDVESITLADLERAFPELAACKSDRSMMEYYFTCTPFLLLYVLTRQEGVELATYLDADLWFFSSPEPVFEEIGESSVAIIPHRFSPNLTHCEVYGIFNVGWVTMRAATDGLACLRWWALRCAEWCHDRAEDGRFADQKYLDQFPSLFAGVHVVRHLGANLAPWNVSNHTLSGSDGNVSVDGQPLVFFHFHGFKFPKRWLVGLPFGLYHVPLTPILRNAIVVPYLRSLEGWERYLDRQPSLPRIGVPGSESAQPPVSWWDIAEQVKAGNYLVRGPRVALLKLFSIIPPRQHQRDHSKVMPKESKPAGGKGTEGKDGSSKKSKPAGGKGMEGMDGSPKKSSNPVVVKPQPPDTAPTSDHLLFTGDYASWEDACSQSLGYDAPLIFEKTRDAIRKVACGEAVFERDSVIFDVPEYPFSTIAGLLHVACARRGTLSVLDFGGSLGSVFFACRPWLDTVSSLRWSVVEQPHYVECGRNEFTNRSLAFHHTMEESMAWHPPDLVLLAGVMQYLPDAMELVDKLCRCSVPYLFIERTSFWEGDHHRIVIQHVPAEIYPASYPCWLFCEKLLLERIGASYEVIASYPNVDIITLEGGRSYFKGMLFRRKQPV